MASGRFLSTSIAEDDRLSKLSLMAEFIYLKTIPHLDRDGMITGRPGLLYSRVCPAREELFGGLLALIDEWVAIGLVIRFHSDEGPVLFFPGFLKNNNLPHYSRERASRFPVPPGFIRTDSGLTPVTVHDLDQDNIQDRLQDLVQDLVQDEVLESVLDVDLQEQEQEQEEDQDQQLKDEDDDDPRARDAMHQAWFETYEAEMPEHLEQPIAELVVECGAEAVSYGIVTSAQAKKRTFKFIAMCARNYIPPAPQPSVNGYHAEVDFMPGVHALAPPANAKPPPLPKPMPTDDPWSIAKAELLPTLSSQARDWLEHSVMQVGEIAGEPLCEILVTHRAANVEWLQRQTEPVIRKKLGSLLGKRVNVGFVIVESEPA